MLANYSTLDLLKLRASFYQKIRYFFDCRNVLEVETPLLSYGANPDPALHSFKTRYHGPGERFNQEFYLNTSPEFCMKRLLADGFPSIYSLGKVFRDGEMGNRHNPEFTLLEWYQLGYGLDDIMNESIDLIQSLAEKKITAKKITYRQLFLDTLQLDPMKATMSELNQCLAVNKIDLTFIPEDKDEYLDLIVSSLIEPKLNPDEITLLYHYPASQASLAKTIEENGFKVGERVEIYWKGLELANGFHELSDQNEQRLRFKNNLEQRKTKQLDQVRIDDSFLEALPKLPDCSGIAFGVDRLIMALLDIKNITKVISFDFNDA